MTDAAFRNALGAEGIIHSPLSRFLGLEFIPASDGRDAEVRMPFSDNLRRQDMEEILHGGVMASLVDLTGAWVVTASGAIPGPTVDYRIDYLRAAHAVEHTARGHIVERDAGYVLVDVTVEDNRGRAVVAARLRYVAV